jgi:hypothetical protein
MLLYKQPEEIKVYIRIEVVKFLQGNIYELLIFL